MTNITTINATTSCKGAFGKGVCIREGGLYQKFINNQRVMATNNTQYKNTLDPNFMYNNIASDIETLNSFYNKIVNPYDVKINLLKYIIQNPTFTIEPTTKHIKDFFNTINPLNIEFSMGSYNWSYKFINNDGKELLLIQNSLLKKKIYDKPYVYDDYIELIKNILDRSGVVFHYKEFRTKRFYKRVDTIFIVSINTTTLSLN